MATSINTSTSGTTFFSGAFSGIDSVKIIENAVYAKLAPKRRIDDQISTNLNKITAFQALRSQADQLKGLFDRLKSDMLGNVFDNKQASYSSSSNIPANSLLTATVTKDALPGSHSIVVQQAAKAFSAQGAIQTSVSAQLGLTGSFDIGQAGGTAATISITATDTIQTLRNKINATTATSGVSADIIQVSPGNYRLIIKGNKEAQPVSVSNITGDNVLESLGMTDSGGNFTDVTQLPQQAIISLNGTTVTSNSNRFENVLTGITLDITNSDPSTTITVNVATNTDGIKQAIRDVVAGYNALLQTINENQLVNADGSIGETSFLHGEYLNSSLGTRLMQSVAGTFGTGAFNGLRSLGITINASNELQINEDALNLAISTNLTDVRSVFETQGSNVGLADSISTLINGYSNFVSGSIQTEINALQTVNSDLTKKSDDIQTNVNQYQLELINRYATLEARMKQADTIKKQILAILEANNSK